jgi:hypothetical protein
VNDGPQGRGYSGCMIYEIAFQRFEAATM